uniref:Uncharacterized protein n=1 Tax=Hyaloperonospora arabidopsidis (strain Emoy2) TaxID=559515 RepID=M4BLA6_HYAAE
MDPFRIPPSAGGPPPPQSPSTVLTITTPYDQMGVMNLIAALQREVRDLQPQAAHSRPVVSTVTMQRQLPYL